MAQKPQCLMFKVAEFQQLAFFFLRREPGVEIPHGIEQRPQPGQSRLAVGFGFFLAAADQSDDLFKQLGRLVRTGAHRRLVVAGQPLFHSLQAGRFFHAQHIGGQPVVQRGPLPCRRQPLHLAQQSGGVFQPEERIGEFLVDACHSLGFGSGGFALFLGLRLCQNKILLAVSQRRSQQLPPRSGAAGRFG